MLAWFALAAASAGAAPCFAMAASGDFVADHAAAHDAAAQHDGSHSSSHDHAVHGAEPEQPAAPPSSCPHCPPGAMLATDGGTGSHSFCSAGDDVADGAKPSVPPTFKTNLSLPLIELGPIDPGLRPVRDQHRPPDATATSVALNLRHCVFLI